MFGDIEDVGYPVDEVGAARSGAVIGSPVSYEIRRDDMKTSEP